MANSRGFDVVTYQQLPNNGIYIRVQVVDQAISLHNIFQSLIDTSWTNAFFSNIEWLRLSMSHRAAITVNKICTDFNNGVNPVINRDTGEKMVSEISRRTLVEDFQYWDMPIAELFKQKADGNPGFDFHTITPINDVLMFGEAKYVTGKTAYNSAMNQIGRFITEGKDMRDLAEVSHFMPSEVPLNNIVNNIKGYIAAFSIHGEKDQDIISKITSHNNYDMLSNYYQFIAIGVDL